MSNPFRFDVTKCHWSLIAKKCDCSLINSESLGHLGVIKCNTVTNVISMCLKILCTVICGIRSCSVSNAAEPFVNV